MYNTMVRTNTKKATPASTSETANNVIANNVIAEPVSTTEVVKAKRGRKSKKDLIASLSNINSESSLVSMELKINEIDTPKNSFDMNKIEIVSGSIDDKNDNNVIISNINIENENEDNDNDNDDVNQSTEKAAIKKRGRKPKGGKIIQPVISVDNQKNDRPNIILHLKCSMKDLQTSNSSSSCIVESYNFGNKNELSYELLNPVNVNLNDSKTSQKQTPSELDYDDDDDDDNEISGKDNNKEIWRKLKQLEHNLHINNVNNKKSACFWCTCDFDNPPVYIPKHFINNTYNVYGCFCSPECGVAHLMHEPIDSSTKFERYHLLNHIYSKIYDYKKNVKPAPNPYYMLDKFYGNLSIQEYRSLLRNERLFLIVDKPLTRILPELHEDNDEFILNNKIIPSNNYQLKSRLQRKKPNKGFIINEKFGLSSQPSILVN
jgi:hypothetical protein